MGALFSRAGPAQRMALQPQAAQANISPVAVCMAGAARTIVHPLVVHTHRHHLLKPLNADRFAVVNLQKDTTHSGLTRRAESKLTRMGTERWRVHAALTLLGARVILFQEDDERPSRNSPCAGAGGGWTAGSMFWNIQLCGEAVRTYETARGASYRWLVRTRPDTFFVAPVRAPPDLALQKHGGFFCSNNDAFFVASASAAPALFALHSLAHDCRWVGNSTLSRGLPANVQCGLQSLRRVKGWIWPDCIMRLAVWRHRLANLGCQETLNTHGRNFFRAHHCNSSAPCVTAGWGSRSPSVHFPMPASEAPSDHGNLTLDADIHEWGVATGAIIAVGGRPRTA